MATLHVPEELAARLTAEAARRGLSVDALSAELLAGQLPSRPAEDHDALESFIGSGDSGDPTWATSDIHDLRSELSARRIETS